MVTIHFPNMSDSISKEIHNYAHYEIRKDGVMVATVYGGMAAIAAEAIIRHLEKGDGSISPIDVIERYRLQK